MMMMQLTGLNFRDSQIPKGAVPEGQSSAKLPLLSISYDSSTRPVGLHRGLHLLAVNLFFGRWCRLLDLIAFAVEVGDWASALAPLNGCPANL